MLKPYSHLVVRVVRMVQEDPKDKDWKLESVVVWVFLNDVNDPNDQV